MFFLNVFVTTCLPNLIADLLEETCRSTPSVFAENKKESSLNKEKISLLFVSKRETHPEMNTIMEKPGVEPGTFSTQQVL
jgi:hypothetical protein